MRTGTVALLLLVGVIVVSALSEERSVVYDRAGAPKGWKLVRRAPASDVITFTIALKQRNVDVLIVSTQRALLCFFSTFSPFLCALSFYFNTTTLYFSTAFVKSSFRVF